MMDEGLTRRIAVFFGSIGIGIFIGLLLEKMFAYEAAIMVGVGLVFVAAFLQGVIDG